MCALWYSQPHQKNDRLKYKAQNTHVNKYVGIIDLQQKTLFANLRLIRQALKIVNTHCKECVTCPFPAFLTFQY